MIILIAGKAEAGKTTFAKMLENILSENNKTVYRLAFGDAVKYIASQLGWDGKKDEKGRALLQLLGDGVRNYSSGFWVKRMMNRIDGIVSQSNGVEPYIIIDDARYENEIELLKELYSSVVTVRLNRQFHKSSLTDEQKLHPSETELDDYDDFDYVFLNNASLEELNYCAEKVVKDVIG